MSVMVGWILVFEGALCCWLLMGHRWFILVNVYFMDNGWTQLCSQFKSTLVCLAAPCLIACFMQIKFKLSSASPYNTKLTNADAKTLLCATINSVTEYSVYNMCKKTKVNVFGPHRPHRPHRPVAGVDFYNGSSHWQPIPHLWLQPLLGLGCASN